MRRPFRPVLKHSVTTGLLAASFFVSSATLPAFAAPGDTNSWNNGQVVQGGTYYNTPDSKTTFVNTGSGGLWVKADTTVRGLEVNGSGALTGNGGTMLFSAPGSVVRIDGTIDVSAVMGKNGFAGNGGRVFIDSAMLYQNGAIYANGRNGGSISVNTGSAIFSPNSITEARGLEGTGGRIAVRASDIVDIQRAAVLDASGKVMGELNTGLIDVSGAMVNVDGLIRANGLSASAEGGVIRLVAQGNADNCFDCTLDSVRTFSTTSAGLPMADDVFSQAEADALIARRNALLNGTLAQDGDIRISVTGQVLAQGAAGESTAVAGGNGGVIIASAVETIRIDGQLIASGGDGFDSPAITFQAPGAGGDGGLITLNALGDIVSSGHLEANGGAGGDALAPVSLADADNAVMPTALGPALSTLADVSARDGASGGAGGVITLGYGETLLNSGDIEAVGGIGGNGASASASDSATGSGVQRASAEALGGDGGTGGQGGLIVFSGAANPVGGGTVNASGGAGGRGGNASAVATAVSTTSDAGSVAKAIAGNGGLGGASGAVVAPSPATFEAAQVYRTHQGVAGHSGDASAMATARGVNQAIALTYAHTGDFGHAMADAAAQALRTVNASAVTEAGDFSETLTLANARTTADSGQGASASAQTTLGDVATGTVRATAYSEKTDAVAQALGAAGNFSAIDATANADGEDWVHAKTYVNTCNDGTSRATANARQHGQVEIDPLAEATAISGQFGTAIALANADGNWLSQAKADAITALAGDSQATANAKSFVDRADATANATSGDFGTASALSRAESTHRNKAANAISSAITGLAGVSTSQADAVVTRGWDKIANATATSLSGDYGTSTARAKADSATQWGTGAKSYATADAKTGAKGIANANADAVTTGRLAKALSKALYAAEGTASAASRAQSTANTTADALAQGVHHLQTGSGLKLANAAHDERPVPVVMPVAPTAPAIPSSTPVNTAILQTQGDELILHDGVAVLLSSAPHANPTISDHLASATVRDVNHLNGGATPAPASTGHLVVSDISGSPLTLDNTGHSALRTLTVISQGPVAVTAPIHVVDAVSVASHGALNVSQAITTTGNTPGAVLLAAGDDVIVNAALATNPLAFHGGAVVVKTTGDLVNHARINADADDSAGRVVLIADGNLINHGVISATAKDVGGQILAKAGEYAVNSATGLIQANALYGSAGYAHLHANNVALNAGTIEARGGYRGGRVLLTAGDRDQTNNARGASVPGLGSAPIFGFSDTALTPAITLLQTQIDPTLAESAINLGSLNVQGCGDGCDGRIYIAGNNQFGVADGSFLNGVEVDVTGILAAPSPPDALQSTMRRIQDNGGHAYLVTGQQIPDSRGRTRTAVETVACDAAPNNDEPDVNPNDPTHQGSEFPDDFTLPRRPVPPPSVRGFDYDLLGLFQEERPLPPPPEYRMILRLNRVEMFMSSQYLPVTEEILAMALGEYHRHRHAGDTTEEAYRHVKLYLAEAGVDADVAKAIAQGVAEGKLRASEPVLAALKAMAEAPTPTPQPLNDLQQ